MSDAVDAIVGQWEKERPELTDALWPVQLIARVQRMHRLLDREAKAFHARHGVETGEFDVLTTLRRSGPPYALTAGAFLKAAMVTSGAITNRIDRMEAKGLVQRVRDATDRRTVRIQLTERGKELTDTLMVEHLENYDRLLDGLDRDEVLRAGELLRKFLELHGDTSIT
ncbi:MarR family winged helix-turn-helix transcriptional regulator [Streptomyces sp. AN091965]|uniref:MarR family winged helix-turn-helix transcriptional regulator n=1 Tax=Streptomyces sp. AN091965 TaxID=2927803 RepID=UPI001F61D382|nr:MarR family transcriptional regulator [Streptomyces sp. AN091965]MCI3932833.1 MarR family transcriptional regulator [Streptomyces sp. AN091965]